ncbi:hypothetical protein IU469_28705 [Nocardia puris]|uniref:Alkylation response protein AidB-like acyl-CoA dehydrogenase n=1 Tax=Nocardia puris TaxID=208602 RepID=A0A366D2E5_9NOCA|nr:acyl-CoA dehydrogenase family protein [Nocardia puris]MBF6369668.1 hypothetical protein [Nocardia puris]RBO83604.1 alkylation response protein AidB-like acyl-CoA dehydrogenase [Nocardia puris]
MTPGFAATYERRVGDPWTGPLSYPHTVSKDEQAEGFRHGTDILRELSLAAEFVPRSLGGRGDDLTAAMSALRAVARHEPGLAFGYGATRLAAARTVLRADGEHHRQSVVERLLADGRVGYAGPGAVLRVDDWPGLPDVVRDRDLLRVNGIRRALAAEDTDLVITSVMVREPDGTVTPRQIVTTTPTVRAARPMVGLRTSAPCDLVFEDQIGSGEELLDIDPPGNGAIPLADEVGIVLAGAAVGILDTGLRVTLRHVSQRRLYGATAADIPTVRAILADAYADLLWCDEYVHTALRAPDRHAAAACCHVPAVLTRAMHRLSTVLGSAFYIREGESAVFQKLLRDLRTAFATRAAPETEPVAVERNSGMSRDDLFDDLRTHHAEDRTLDLEHRPRGT